MNTFNCPHCGKEISAQQPTAKIVEPAQDKQYREVKRAAKVGEKIKIVNAIPCLRGQNYKNGDTFVCTKAGLVENGDIFVDGVNGLIDGAEYVVLESPFSEPSPKITVTRQMLVDLKACSDGLRDFDRQYPSGESDYDTMISDCKSRHNTEYLRWLASHKQRIIDWKPVEYYNGKVFCAATGDLALTSGKIYNIEDGYLRWNDGEKFNQRFKSFNDFKNWFNGKTIWHEVIGEQS